MRSKKYHKCASKSKLIYVVTTQTKTHTEAGYGGEGDSYYDQNYIVFNIIELEQE